jgi:hypothetical protein
VAEIIAAATIAINKKAVFTAYLSVFSAIVCLLGVFNTNTGLNSPAYKLKWPTLIISKYIYRDLL